MIAFDIVADGYRVRIHGPGINVQLLPEQAREFARDVDQAAIVVLRQQSVLPYKPTTNQEEDEDDPVPA